jgi:hypothetical protein
MCVESISDTQGSVGEVGIVDCTAEHDGEVFAVFDIEGDDDADFPGSSEVEDQASSGCEDRFEDYVGVSFQESRFLATFLSPTEETWAQGDREVVCFAYVDEGTLTESIEGSNE